MLTMRLQTIWEVIPTVPQAFVSIPELSNTFPYSFLLESQDLECPNRFDLGGMLPSNPREHARMDVNVTNPFLKTIHDLK